MISYRPGTLRMWKISALHLSLSSPSWLGELGAEPANFLLRPGLLRRLLELRLSKLGVPELEVTGSEGPPAGIMVKMIVIILTEKLVLHLHAWEVAVRWYHWQRHQSSLQIWWLKWSVESKIIQTNVRGEVPARLKSLSSFNKGAWVLSGMGAARTATCVRK